MDTVIRAPKQELVVLDSEPEPLEIDLRRTAVVVIDMTNAFVKKGAFFDLRGQDISRCEKTIAPIKKVTYAARARGCKIIHIAHRYSLGTDFPRVRLPLTGINPILYGCIVNTLN